jgi:4-amino-4-deoxy-L-arabinose transferase-like glycosyltransferase
MAARPLLGDENHYWSAARQIAAGATPRPDFVWPPLYSWLIAGSIRLFGDTRIPLELLQSGLFLASALFLHSLLLRLPVPTRAADAACFLFVLDLEVAAFTQFFWPEILFLFLFLLGTWLVLDKRARLGSAAGGGIAFGAALLTKSLIGPFLAVVALAATVNGRRVFRGAAFALAVAAVVVPVAATNRVLHGSFSIAPSGPFNLWVGLNDPDSTTDYDSRPAAEMSIYLASADGPEGRNRVAWQKARELVRHDGVLAVVVRQVRKQYFRLLHADSYFTDQLAGGRFADPAVPAGAGEKAARLAAHGVYAAILVAASLGVFLVSLRELRGSMALPSLYLAFNLGLFLFLHVKTRYRIGFLPALIAFAALGIARAPDAASHDRWRLVGGIALAALALVLAFVPR